MGLNLGIKNGKDNLYYYSSALCLNSSLYCELPNVNKIIVGIYSASWSFNKIGYRWSVQTQTYAHSSSTHKPC